ncbi:MAG: hypothetical protein JJE04_05330 [Acidobacteriia bacterium]|nr:hypothetical protein [Terriglobia bacterium]
MSSYFQDTTLGKSGVVRTFSFSAFSLDTLLLVRSGAWGMAGLNVAAGNGLCLAGVRLGYAVTVWLRRR